MVTATAATGRTPQYRAWLRDETRRRLCQPRHVCNLLGLERGSKAQSGGGLKVLCPSHEEQDASCSVTQHEDGLLRVRCHACGFAGDVFHLVAATQQLDPRRDFERVLDFAAELAGLSPDGDEPAAPRLAVAAAPPAPRPAAPASTGTVAEVWEGLSPIDADTWEYLRERHLDEAAGLCRSVPEEGGPPKLHGMRLAVGLHDAEGRVVAIQARNLADRHDFRVEGKSHEGCFGDPSRLRDMAIERVVLAEGMSDYLAASIAMAGDENTLVLGIAGATNTRAVEALPLGRRQLVIATDADEAGDKCAARLTAALTPKGVQCLRARPTGGKDLCDMRAAGQDLTAFLRAAKPPRTKKANVVEQGFEALRGERAERLAERGRSLSFGVRFLDTLLGGLHPNDVVLVGAKTGRGKTELLTGVAEANATAGLRVRYFALEAERMEIQRRLKYRVLSQRVHSCAMGPVYLNYMDWRQGELDSICARHEEEVDRELEARYRTLKVLYRTGNFTAADFCAIAEETAHETDLFILDHVHVVDVDDDNENRGLKRVVQSISDLAMQLSKPIVMAGHLRKTMPSRVKQLVPSIEDFHGSSDLVKIATKVLMLAPADDQQRPAPYLSPTYMHSAKCRRDGTRTRYLGLLNYNHRAGWYENSFDLGKLSAAGDTCDMLPRDEWPAWARRGEGDRWTA